MIPSHLRFDVLKRRVSIEQVLRARGWLARMRRRAGRLVGPCPVHDGDNPTAFVVSEDRQLWYCFSGCSRGGDVVELLRLLDGLSYAQTARELARFADLALDDTIPATPRPPSPPPRPQRPFRPFIHRLPLDPCADVLAAKGIEPATAAAFDAGLWHGRGFLEGCVAVRLHDLSGRPLGYAGRRLSPRDVATHGKWKFPPRLPKSQILFNYHRVADRQAEPLALVECPWGVMRLAQVGLPAMALLGLHLSTKQQRMLERWGHIVLVLDGDDAGRRATERLERELRAAHVVHIIELDNGQDPDDLNDSDLLRRLIPSWLSAASVRQ